MVLTKRDRLALLIMAIVLGATALYYKVASPLLERRAELRDEVSRREQELRRVNLLLANDKTMRKAWSERTGRGLLDDASRAGIQASKTVSDWAREAGLDLSSVKSDPKAEADKYYRRVIVRAAGTGSMASLARFLWRVQVANIPVRVTDLTVSSRKDAVDDLSVAIGISTLCLPEPPKGARPEAPAPPKEEP